MNDTPKNVLFLCTGNSCRSIIAEALLNHLGGGRYRGFSAGSQPAGVVNPAALEALQRHGIGGQDFRSKNWHEFAAKDTPEMDMVLTVCDNAAGEVCPVWPGHPLSSHWGVPDPATFQGTTKETADFFDRVLAMLQRRIEALLAIPVETLAPEDVQNRLQDIGNMKNSQ